LTVSSSMTSENIARGHPGASPGPTAPVARPNFLKEGANKHFSMLSGRRTTGSGPNSQRTAESQRTGGGGPPLKVGYALKRGTSGFFSSFARHKRWFKLDASGFVYGEDAEAADTGKRIDVFLSRIVQKSSSALEVVTAEKTYPLEFANRDERDSWYKALLSAQQQRADAVEALIIRLERALEKRAASGNASLERGESRVSLQSAKPATPVEILERLDALTRRLERVAA